MCDNPSVFSHDRLLVWFLPQSSLCARYLFPRLLLVLPFDSSFVVVDVSGFVQFPGQMELVHELSRCPEFLETNFCFVFVFYIYILLWSLSYDERCCDQSS